MSEQPDHARGIGRDAAALHPHIRKRQIRTGHQSCSHNFTKPIRCRHCAVVAGGLIPRQKDPRSPDAADNSAGIAPDRPAFPLVSAPFQA